MRQKVYPVVTPKGTNQILHNYSIRNLYPTKL